MERLWFKTQVSQAKMFLNNKEYARVEGTSGDLRGSAVCPHAGALGRELWGEQAERRGRRRRSVAAPAHRPDLDAVLQVHAPRRHRPAGSWPVPPE